MYIYISRNKMCINYNNNYNSFVGAHAQSFLSFFSLSLSYKRNKNVLNKSININSFLYYINISLCNNVEKNENLESCYYTA